MGIEFASLAKDIGLTPAQLSILWVKDQPGITAPLIGPRTVEQLESLLPVKDMHLDDETRTACDRLATWTARDCAHNQSHCLRYEHPRQQACLPDSKIRSPAFALTCCPGAARYLFAYRMLRSANALR